MAAGPPPEGTFEARYSAYSARERFAMATSLASLSFFAFSACLRVMPERLGPSLILLEEAKAGMSAWDLSFFTGGPLALLLDDGVDSIGVVAPSVSLVPES